MIGTNTGVTINTGTATTGNTSAWAMKLTAITDSSITYNPNNLSIVDNFNAYHNVPNALTKVVQYKNSDSTISSATDQTLGAHVETTYAALVSPTQAADTYTGKVRYLLVHPANFTTGTYSITYNANGGTGTMSSESNIPNYEPHTIPTSTLTPPSGYTLAGWCTVQDQTASGVVQNADPQTTCTGDSYTTTIPASTVANNTTLTLYAYWALPTMQSVSTWKNTLVNTGDEITAIDSRDGKTYTVAKLADGNIWMTQNLDHDIGDINGGTYTPADTDIPSNWTPTGSELTRQTSDTTWTSSNTAPESYDPGTLYWSGDFDPPRNQATCEAYGGEWNDDGLLIVGCEGASGISTIASTGNDHYYFGNYYNWTAAVAMSDSSSYTTKTDVDQSICPAGWMLPKESGSGSFSYLQSEVGLDVVFTSDFEGNGHISPYWLAYVGQWNGSLRYVGGTLGYWSSVTFNSRLSHVFYASSASIPPAPMSISNVGLSVRCIAR